MSDIKIEELIQIIYEKYDKKVASENIGKILQRISRGGSYHDIYEYIREIGLGQIFKDVIDSHEFVMNMEQYNQVAKEFMQVVNKYCNDITDLSELVQKSLNESMGIGLKPKTVKPDQKEVSKVVDTLIKGLPIESDTIASIGDFDSDLMKFTSELIDSTIIANAEIQSKSGFNIVVVRRYDDVGIHDYSKYSDSGKRKTIRGAKECPFCKEREGVYEYEATKKDKRVWQRHPGCSCSIDYVNKGMTDRVQNYIRV